MPISRTMRKVHGLAHSAAGANDLMRAAFDTNAPAGPRMLALPLPRCRHRQAGAFRE